MNRYEEAAPATKQSAATVPLRTTAESTTFYHSQFYFDLRAAVRGITLAAILIFVVYVAWSLAWVIT
jgi:hypothetical protein